MEDLTPYLARGTLDNCLRVDTNNDIDLYTCSYRDEDGRRNLFLKINPNDEFEREALRRERNVHFEAAMASDHVAPLHTLPLYDALGEIPHVATELHPGTIYERIDEMRHRPELMARFLLDACRGLSDIHAAGLVHRDIKPENIIYTLEEKALLIDFGTTVYSGHRAVPRIVTPKFFPPEVERSMEYDEPIEADASHDHYSMARTVEDCLHDSIEFFPRIVAAVKQNKSADPKHRPGLEPLIAELTTLAR